MTQPELLTPDDPRILAEVTQLWEANRWSHSEMEVKNALRGGIQQLLSKVPTLSLEEVYAKLRAHSQDMQDFENESSD